MTCPECNGEGGYSYDVATWGDIESRFEPCHCVKSPYTGPIFNPNAPRFVDIEQMKGLQHDPHP